MSGRNFSGLFQDVLTEGLSYFLTTGGTFMTQPVGRVTQDGYGDVFISNVFGHYVLVRSSYFLFFCSSFILRLEDLSQPLRVCYIMDDDRSKS